MSDWNDAERRVERAQHLFEQRKWSQALRELQAATSINPYNPAWFFNMGLILDELDRFDEALHAYRRAAALEPNDLQILNHLGMAEYRVGQIKAALATFQSMEAIDASFEPSYCRRVMIYAQTGEHELAEEMFYTARLYKEHCPNCLYHLGLSLEARGMYDKAIYCWTRSLDLHGPLDDVHIRIARAFWKKGECEEARQYFLTDLRLNPGRTQTLLELGQLLIEMGRGQEAGEKFRQAIELSPQDPGGYYHYGNLLLHDGREQEAFDSFATVLRLDPTFAGAQLGLGKLHLRRGQVDQAAARFCAEARLAGEFAPFQLELANLLMDVNELPTALLCLQRIVQNHPKWVAARLNLAVAQFKCGQYPEGIGTCEEVLAQEPDNLTAMYNLALANEHLGKIRVARRWIGRARRRDPDDAALLHQELRLRWLAWRQRFVRVLAHFIPALRRKSR